ncbi:helix-turn-helix domain-containing protein [Ensifer aridi]|uniref:helix-turn-helix domain-containing protein n=1 Tax=Ensifer aridi TaxID=1708715 RepID=UPI000A10371F|nr:helix-turn-helix domain-containing protein [Ensifer aridi]
MHRPQRTDKPRETSIDKLEELADIKRKLILAGLSLYDVDRRFSLPRGTAGTTLREPNAAGERAIAAALGTRAHLLWPSRYRPSGQRRSPQPRENYERPPTMRQRQKAAGV